jgi:hypothetical protein
LKTSTKETFYPGSDELEVIFLNYPNVYKSVVYNPFYKRHYSIYFALLKTGLTPSVLVEICDYTPRIIFIF